MNFAATEGLLKMRRARVEILTVNDLQIFGNITINQSSDSYYAEISNLLNNSRNFIELTEVEIRGSNDQLLVTMPFLCVNKPVIAFLFEAASHHKSLVSSGNSFESSQGISSREMTKVTKQQDNPSSRSNAVNSLKHQPSDFCTLWI